MGRAPARAVLRPVRQRGGTHEPGHPVHPDGTQLGDGRGRLPDETQLAARGSPLPVRNLATGYYIGQQGNFGGNGAWQGDIVELLVYNQALSPTELAATWNYLKAKYALGSASGTGGAGNVISGNTGDGVSITGSGTTANKVTGNFVGTTAAGTAAVANTGSGVRISDGATNNTVGGTTAGARNVLSGNAQYGVQLADGGTTGNVVAGNYVGTDATGTARLANTTGVRLEPGADGTTIGGTAAGAGNLIAGNTGTGVSIGRPGNVVQGNRIGLTTAGLPWATRPAWGSTAGRRTTLSAAPPTGPAT